ncbi:MAG: hypothetical protein RR590_01620, partial [Hungatella sp.]
AGIPAIAGIPAKTRTNLKFASQILGHFLSSNEEQYMEKSPEMQAFQGTFPYIVLRSNPYLFGSLESPKYAIFKLFVSYVLVTNKASKILILLSTHSKYNLCQIIQS